MRGPVKYNIIADAKYEVLDISLIINSETQLRFTYGTSSESLRLLCHNVIRGSGENVTLCGLAFDSECNLSFQDGKIIVSYASAHTPVTKIILERNLLTEFATEILRLIDVAHLKHFVAHYLD